MFAFWTTAWLFFCFVVDLATLFFRLQNLSFPFAGSRIFP